MLAALSSAAVIGLLNGVLVAVLELNALIVTLAIGAITSGVTLWYRKSSAGGITRSAGNGGLGRFAPPWPERFSVGGDDFRDRADDPAA